jgi:2,3-dimethylmalate lyase
MHFEDQTWPKKCGHMEGKQVIPLEEMVQKIRAAVDARCDTDLVIIGRTDANGVHGIEEAIRRGWAYSEAGADALLIEAPRSIEEMRYITRTFRGIPLVFNWVESGKTPLLSLEEVHALGYSMVIYSVSLLFAATHRLLETLHMMKQGQTSNAFSANMVTFSQFTQHIGLPAIQEIERRYKIS